MIHEALDWPEIAGLSLEHVIALGRTGTPGAFYDMLQSGLTAKAKCPFCDMAHLQGTICYENKLAYVFIPPGDFNRNKGALEHKFVIVLKRHTADPSTLTNRETLALQHCRRYLKQHHNCYHPDRGGASYMRHGSTIFNAGTVIGHLHENVDEPNGLASVRPAIYKDLDGWKKDRDRLSGYIKAYEADMTRAEYLQSYRMHHDDLF